MATAFGIAVSGAGGVRRNFGTMAKALQTGNAARNGVNAALLAQKGFTADRTILEAPMGFASALCLESECDWEMLTKGLGEIFYMEQQPAIKRFPTCTPAHRPIEGLLELRQRHGFSADEVASVECDFHVRSMCRAEPEEVAAGPNSMPFILASALLEGEVTLAQFSEAKIHDPKVRAVMKKIIHAPLAHERGQPEPPDRIIVKLNNGAVHAIEVPARHTLTTKTEIHAKYMACATLALSRTRAAKLAELIDDLESVSESATLMNCLNGAELLKEI
jgi:2-methylcitrate dehydratase PrpD